jgi:shikimate dehydrogenase
MHEREAAAHGIRCLYQLLDLDMIQGGAATLPALLDAAERVGFAGLNITHPCKQAVIAHLTSLSNDARVVGAVNTIVFQQGARTGHNTDWRAFAESFRRELPGAPLGHVVQLGAGGAGAATAYAALHLGVQRLDVIDTNEHRATTLGDRFAAQFPGRVFVAHNAAAALESADGLIHATPTGMAGYPGLPIAASLIRQDLWVADVVYVPLETALLRLARARGCRTLDGAGMAVWQAVEAFRLFTGLSPDHDRIHRFFREAATA